MGELGLGDGSMTIFSKGNPHAVCYSLLGEVYIDFNDICIGTQERMLSKPLSND